MTSTDRPTLTQEDKIALRAMPSRLRELAASVRAAGQDWSTVCDKSLQIVQIIDEMESRVGEAWLPDELRQMRSDFRTMLANSDRLAEVTRRIEAVQSVAASLPRDADHAGQGLEATYELLCLHSEFREQLPPGLRPFYDEQFTELFARIRAFAASSSDQSSQHHGAIQRLAALAAPTGDARSG